MVKGQQAANKLQGITRALDFISYEWLGDAHPQLLDAIEQEIGSGADPSAIRRHVMRLTDRLELALRCEQAARHLARVGEAD